MQPRDGGVDEAAVAVAHAELPEHLETFDEVVGLLALNSDGHVSGKLARMGEHYAVC